MTDSHGRISSTDTRPARAGVLLAGGSSSRFGSDKLAALLDGRPILWHAAAALASAVDELVIVAGADRGGEPFPSLPVGLEPAPIVVHDAAPGAGPLVALMTGLRATTAPVVIVAAGDMPRVPSVLARLLAAALEADRHAGLALLVQEHERRPLPCAVRAVPVRAAAERLVARGERSLRSLANAVRVARIEETVWRGLDPLGEALIDVDTPADLAALQASAGSTMPR